MKRPVTLSHLVAAAAVVVVLSLGAGVGAQVGLARYQKLQLTSTAADAADIAGGVTVAGNPIISTAGKVPALSSTYLGSLSGANLTGLPAANLTGTVPIASIASGSCSDATFVRGDQTCQSVTAAAVPTGAIFYFNGACPTGFSEFTDARGRYIVGLVSGGTLDTGVGTALTNQENRTHTHGVPGLSVPGLSVPGLSIPGLGMSDHDHFGVSAGSFGVSGTTGAPNDGGVAHYGSVSAENDGATTTHGHGFSASVTGTSGNTGGCDGGCGSTDTGTTGTGTTGTGTSGTGTSGTNSTMDAPYIQLRACQKT